MSCIGMKSNHKKRTPFRCRSILICVYEQRSKSAASLLFIHIRQPLMKRCKTEKISLPLLRLLQGKRFATIYLYCKRSQKMNIAGRFIYFRQKRSRKIKKANCTKSLRKWAFRFIVIHMMAIQRQAFAKKFAKLAILS